VAGAIFRGAVVTLGALLGLRAAAFSAEDGHPRAHYTYIASDIRKPDWATRPNGQEIARLYPDETDAPVEGAAAMRCKVFPNGVLQACTLLDERPAGFGFGRATLLLARYFTLKTVQRDGRPILGRTVVVPIQFRY
jgi:protein TonB